ncbi:MAG TPA: sugar phosphate isomerase/epimerase family protein [Terriglobia bacterium]|nr:sugar phosphate isomerase/epimerase family protein [Terriglobia bacterium]
MKLAAFPKCYMDALCVERTMTVFDWIEMAAGLGVDGLEMYPGFFTSLEDTYLDHVDEALKRHGLAMPMLCCSPDFTQPDPAARRQEIERERRLIDVAARLGGGFCRVLSGQRRPGLAREEGVERVVSAIEELLPHAESRGVVLTLENHYKDGYWQYPEFAQKSAVFLEIVERIGSPWFGVQYDPSNAVIAGEDPLALLEQVRRRVVTMHASDRYLKPGFTLEDLSRAEEGPGYAAILVHGVTGKGLNDYPRIFSLLREVGFDGWVSIEDGMGGLEEIRESAGFLRRLMQP